MLLPRHGSKFERVFGNERIIGKPRKPRKSLPALPCLGAPYIIQFPRLGTPQTTHKEKSEGFWLLNGFFALLEKGHLQGPEKPREKMVKLF